MSQRAGAADRKNLALAKRVVIEDIGLYVPHYPLNKSNQKLMLGHIVSKAATELSYFKTSSWMKNVTTEKKWTFELGVGDGIDIPICLTVGFIQKDQFNQQHQKRIHSIDLV